MLGWSRGRGDQWGNWDHQAMSACPYLAQLSRQPLHVSLQPRVFPHGAVRALFHLPQPLHQRHVLRRSIGTRDEIDSKVWKLLIIFQLQVLKPGADSCRFSARSVIRAKL
jgi:hypothetical protein